MIRWAFVMLALSGCQSVADGAKEDFSRGNTCPIERVEARARPELKPSQFRRKATPAADISADPGRLKMWQDKQAADAAYNDDYHQIVEVRGCGQHEFYECRHPGSGSTSGVRWMCTTERYVPGTISKW
jgi:hypothetical protein